MIQLLRQQCCCGGPCPCAVSDDFAVDSIGDYDVTGTFSVASGVLTASTAGTATQDLKLPVGTRAAGVKADVTNNSHVLFGLVIGSGDNRIEWLWDVAGTQCTLKVYSGGTAIVDQDYAGAPTASLEVQILWADCAWDITVYRDGVLVATHLAVAVTFDEDWTAFGVTANDASGGTWDNLCLRSCGTICELMGCAASDLLMPPGYTLSAGTVSDNGAYADTYQPTGCCDLFSDDWTCLHNTRAMTYFRSLLGPSVFFATDAGSNGCSYHAIDESTWTEDENVASVTGPSGCSSDDAIHDGITEAHNPATVGATAPGTLRRVTKDVQEVSEVCAFTRIIDGLVSGCTIAGPWRIDFDVTGSAGSYSVTAIARANMIFDDGSGMSLAVYESAPVSVGSNNRLSSAGPITLNLDTAATVLEDGDGDPLCTFPASITITPLSGADISASGLLSGSDGCDTDTRCPNLYSEHGILRLDGTLNSQEFQVCLSGPEGLSNGPFTGTIIGNEQGWTGACAGENMSVTLECKRVCEHTYAWVLTFDDGASVAEITYEPAAAPNVGDVVSGTLDLCGTTGLAFAAYLVDFTGYPAGEHPFADYCDPDLLLLCVMADSLRVRGQSDGSLCVPASCTSTIETLGLTQGEILCGGTPITSTGFDDEKPYFRGPLPVNDGFGTFTGFQIVLFFNGSALQALMLDATNCIVDAGAVSIDCESLTGTIDFANLNTACCASGSFKVHFG